MYISTPQNVEWGVIIIIRIFIIMIIIINNIIGTRAEVDLTFIYNKILDVNCFIMA